MAIRFTPGAVVLHGHGYRFRPTAEVAFAGGLARSGLLSRLSPRELQTLLGVLSCVTANGWVRPTLHEAALALRVSEAEAALRLLPLTLRKFAGQPVLRRVGRDGARSVYVPSPAILSARDAPPGVIPLPEPSPRPPGAGRDRVVAASRERHAVPKDVVERRMADEHGWPLVEELEAEEARRLAAPPALSGEDATVAGRLEKLGVHRESADRLVRSYGRERAVRQIVWLPLRHAKEPGKFLAAAIAGDFEEPRPGT